MDRTGENVVTDRLQPPPQGIRVKSRWLRNILTFFVVFGPGLIVMEADNDAGRFPPTHKQEANTASICFG